MPGGSAGLPGPPPGRCGRCFLRARYCVCHRVPRVPTRTRILVLRHAHEAWKTSNTARLAALALPACDVVDHGGRDAAPLDPARLAGSWLLYPDGPPGTPAGLPPAQLVVLDGTWQQARRMLQRLPALRRLPRLSLPPPPAARRLRRPPLAAGMSTLEAIAGALAVLEGEDRALPLRRLYREVVARSLVGHVSLPPGLAQAIERGEDAAELLAAWHDAEAGDAGGGTR